MKIIKRDGSEVPFNCEKIKNAIEAANAEVAEADRLSDTEVGFIVGRIEKRCDALGRSVSVEEIQDMVVEELASSDHFRLALHYSDYRLRHELLRKQNSTDAKVLALLRHDNELAKQENANKDPIINSTMRDYLASEVSEDICRRYIFPEDVMNAHDEGIIHVHDMGYVSGPISNCELVNLEDMLQNGTVITDTLIEKPHSFSTACNIATQIIAQVASNTYGGQTISLAHLAPFVDVSRQKYRREARAELTAVGKDFTEAEVNRIAEMRVLLEIEKGIQTIQYQIQTLLTTNGQTPFVSVFMYLDEVEPGQTRDDLALIIAETLNQRYEGIKNEVGVWVSPAFPKLIYVLDEDNITEDAPYYYLTELAAKCTAKRMVPDYISAKIMKQLKNGDVYTCMGCRAFLTPDTEGMNPDGSHKYYGRFNQGAVTINLVDVACSAEGDEQKFWSLLNERCELCFKALVIRHNTLKGTPSDVAPMPASGIVTSGYFRKRTDASSTSEFGGNMNNRTLTLGSLFDGSGGFPFGGILAGVEPRWASEIEPFPILVTHKRLPTVKHYGDVSTLSGAELEPVDIITFGSPCQDLSIAGKRAGIQEGERSNLFFQAIRIIKEMREKTNGEYPRYCVWENVPGAFSSNGGADFKAVLEAVIGVKEEGIEVPAPANHRWPKSDVYLGDGWSVAYRVLDAQYWGVPQRRARIYLVADFTGGSAPEVLFKSEGVSGYTPQGFRSWEGTAGGAEEGAGETGGGSDHRGGTICVNTQGNSGVGITEEKSLALVAQDHGNHPAVLQAAGFSTEHSAKARSIGYEEEVSPTLRAGVVPAAMAIESNPTDSRVKISEEGVVQTLTRRMGTGGNNTPLIAQPDPVTLKIRCGRPGGGKGPLLTHDKSATLGTNNDQTLFQPKAYGVCSKSSHAMLSDNPHSGFYEAKTSRTLDQSGGNAVTSNQGGICVVAPATETYDVRFTSKGTKNARGHCYPTEIARCLDTSEQNPDGNHGGVCVVEEQPAYALQGSMIGRKDENGPQGDGVNEEVSFTLNTTDKHAVAAPTYCATTGSYMEVTEEKSSTLMARDYKDPKIINDAPNDEPVYIVRRLTPVECARLQGFPDWWCDELAIPEPTEEQIAFWMEVWETWRSVTNPGGKPKTEKQIRKWLESPYTDAAEYKLWGNGISLPIVYFVLSGIAWAANQ